MNAPLLHAAVCNAYASLSQIELLPFSFFSIQSAIVWGRSSEHRPTGGTPLWKVYKRIIYNTFRFSWRAWFFSLCRDHQQALAERISLSKHLANSQEELPAKTMKESEIEVHLPLGTQPSLREKYLNFHNSVRYTGMMHYSLAWFVQTHFSQCLIRFVFHRVKKVRSHSGGSRQFSRYQNFTLYKWRNISILRSPWSFSALCPALHCVLFPLLSAHLLLSHMEQGAGAIASVHRYSSGGQNR